MNEPWITILSALLPTIGVLAAANLMRVFISESRDGRRERTPRRGGRLSPRRAATRDHPRARDRRSAHARLATMLIGPTLGMAGAAYAQDTLRVQGDQGVPLIPDAPQPSTPGSDKVAPPELKSPFSLQLNLDYTTAYFYHGIIQEDSGLILQPAARLTINLYEEGDFRVDALAGIWNSFHGQKTGARTHGEFTEYWYEADLIGGVVMTKGKFSLTTTYTFLTSPSDAYETVQELDFTLAYDDSDLFGAFALHPYVLFGLETGADASDGADSDTGAYLEIGIAPGFSVNFIDNPVAITFPASVGLSLHNYYQNASGDDDTFGFAQVGVKASVALPFADRYGKWTLYGGVSALFLGDQTTAYNGGHDSEIIGTVGLQLNF